jgi:hypothetical protein
VPTPRPAEPSDQTAEPSDQTATDDSTGIENAPLARTAAAVVPAPARRAVHHLRRTGGDAAAGRAGPGRAGRRVARRAGPAPRAAHRVPEGPGRRGDHPRAGAGAGRWPGRATHDAAGAGGADRVLPGHPGRPHVAGPSQGAPARGVRRRACAGTGGAPHRNRRVVDPAAVRRPGHRLHRPPRRSGPRVATHRAGLRRLRAPGAAPIGRSGRCPGGAGRLLARRAGRPARRAGPAVRPPPPGACRAPGPHAHRGAARRPARRHRPAVHGVPGQPADGAAGRGRAHLEQARRRAGHPAGCGPTPTRRRRSARRSGFLRAPW